MRFRSLAEASFSNALPRAHPRRALAPARAGPPARGREAAWVADRPCGPGRVSPWRARPRGQVYINSDALLVSGLARDLAEKKSK